MNLKLILLLNLYLLPTNTKADFSKIVIWGHKLYSHTHSFIHYGFYNAFKHMGYNTFWLDETDDLSNFDFSNSLFITESQADKNLPIADDCYYILHNCDFKKYEHLYNNNQCILLQVYTNDCLKYKLERLEPFVYANYQEKIICMPWATDLLPDEINEIKKNVPTMLHTNQVNFIGTVGGGVHGNENEINPFVKACSENNINFNALNNCKTSALDNIKLIQKSYMAPALQGKWQCDNGYIPCRIFKNVSYGQYPITNSKAVSELFNNKIVYNSDTYQLFYDAQKKLNNLNLQELYDAMDFVRDNHTYINRINTLLNFIEKALFLK
ncbi:MAG: hypothetical protein P4L22_01395 [Candidatus Babeliales bacterium]|nr:hypothetical protein [Candidatus Babeliales bacterium]